jgi:hypothetical protein
MQPAQRCDLCCQLHVRWVVDAHETELQKATEYWGKAYGKNPRDATAAINYAKNLKALGERGVHE